MREELSISRRRTLAGLVAASGLAASLPGCALTPAHTPHDPAQQAAIARAQRYLDELRGLRARFTQIGPDEAVAGGTAWYDPGHLRLQYDTPARRLLVAGGGRLVLHDEATGAVTRASLAVNPLGLLLSGPVRLSGEIDVTDVREAPGALQLSLARSSNPAQGLLTLLFQSDAAGALLLSGLQAVDAHGHHTRFQLSDQQSGLSFAPSLFAMS
jgi:outer membrane lipoprotein-sorting protein